MLMLLLLLLCSKIIAGNLDPLLFVVIFIIEVKFQRQIKRKEDPSVEKKVSSDKIFRMTEVKLSRHVGPIQLFTFFLQVFEIVLHLLVTVNFINIKIYITINRDLSVATHLFASTWGLLGVSLSDHGRFTVLVIGPNCCLVYNSL